MIWFVAALSGAALLAIVNLLDVYLFEDDVYENPMEPAVTSGVMQLLPWLLIPVYGFSVPEDHWITILAVCAGLLNIIAYFLYFKAIFASKDASLTTIFWNLLLAVVPLLAFLFLKESLTLREYLGIAFIFLGANIIALAEREDGDGKKIFWRVAKLMVVAVVLMGISVVFLKGAYDHTDYWSGYLAFTFGMALGSVIIYALFLRKKQKRRFAGAVRKFFWLFLGIEGLNVLGEMASTYALSNGSASLVTAVESMQPAFVVLFALVIFVIARRVRSAAKNKKLRDIYEAQMVHLPFKLAAVFVMVIGAYLVG